MARPRRRKIQFYRAVVSTGLDADILHALHEFFFVCLDGGGGGTYGKYEVRNMNELAK